MTADIFAARRSHGGLIATVAFVVFLACGLGLIGAAIASQRTAPQPRAISETPSQTPRATSLPLGQDALTLPRSKPATLDIPTIGVHSKVQDLGRTSTGALETPAPGPHYDEAAWYRHSPTPGSLGPAILMGHVDSASNGPSVFFRLGELRPGGRVSVTGADGSVAVFVVEPVHGYGKENFPTYVVHGDIRHAGLRIITCGGAFDAAAGH